MSEIGLAVFLFLPKVEIEVRSHPPAAVILHPVGGPATICFPEPTQSPTLPLRLACGFNPVSCQSNIVAGFEDIVGGPPWEGVQVYRLNPGPGRQPTNFAAPDGFRA